MHSVDVLVQPLVVVEAVVPVEQRILDHQGDRELPCKGEITRQRLSAHVKGAIRLSTVIRHQHGR